MLKKVLGVLRSVRVWYKRRLKWWLKYRLWAARRHVRKIGYSLNGGYSCNACGTKIPLYNYIVDGEVGSRRMLFSNWSRKCYCPSCTYDKIEYFFDHAIINKTSNAGNLYIGKCDFTGIVGPVVDIICGDKNALDLNVRFGAEFWNGFSASKEAFRLLLKETGFLRTDNVITPRRGRWKYLDANGVVAKSKSVRDVKQR